MAYINVDDKQRFLEIKGIRGIGDIDFSYDISFDRIANKKEIEDWVNHLRDKNWWSEQLELDFISACDRINKKQNGLV